MSDDIQLPECGDSIDQATFEQILEMDDDEEDRDFSKSIVFGFFDQAHKTFGEMDDNIEKGNLEELSSLGHFLKGSSATLGLTNIRNGCEKIQHLGKGKDEAGNTPQSDDKCLAQIKSEVKKCRDDYAKVERALKKFYGEPADA